MYKPILAAAATAVLALGVAGCGSSGSSSSSSSSGGGGNGAKVGIILPDTASSARYETQDRPDLTAACEANNLNCDIQNAQGDVSKFQSLADQMISGGVKVLVIDNLDNDSGAAVISKAKAQGIPVIDYDRLTLGGGAQYYVSFDNTIVGTKIGTGLVKCMQANGKNSGPVALLNGSPTDNNATLFKNGYEAAIKAAGYTIAADQSVPDWNNTAAGTIFEQMYTKANGKFNGVAAANDGLGGAVISVLARNGQAGKIPVTGQDATVEGLQRVLLGTQCVTIFKPVKQEAETTVKLATAIATGDTAAAEALATKTADDSKTGKPVPAVLLDPQQIFPEQVKDVVAGGGATAAQICTTAELQAKCKQYGVS